MTTQSFFDAIEEVRRRSAESIVARSGLNHAGLAAEIRRRFGDEDPTIGGVMHEPILEAAPPYVTADVTLNDLGCGLLANAMIAALDGESDPRERVYRFRRHWRPYSHQLAAWQALKEEPPQSVLVTSGTGSGKTECFLVPIIDDLARQAETQRLEGVQAIVLYPLNALIASQEERLREWTAPFAPGVRFALYNRMLEEEVEASMTRLRPEMVSDRKTLRASPPPILVTNVTMLEYILLRKADTPIVDKSKGKLKYIVLDEAHSYVGVQAAEIALLLRRVCLAFGVEPSEVRFIATSATIGGSDAEKALRRFLCGVSGVPESRVRVVAGEPRKPILPPLGGDTPLTAEDLSDADPEKLFDILGGHPRVRPLLDALNTAPTPLSVIENQARPLGVSGALLTAAIGIAARGDESLGPLRMHVFHRTVPGLWTCLDPACPEPRPAQWPFGALATFYRERCACGAPAYEISCCSECGEPFVEATERADGKLVQSRRVAAVDEFEADSEATGEVADGDAEEEGELESLLTGPQRRIATRIFSGALFLHVDTRTWTVVDKGGAGRLSLYAHIADPSCPACGAVRRPGRSCPIRPFRFLAPFILGTATPVLLAAATQVETPAGQVPVPPPSEGRQLLTFTDSRQGTARFAAKLQIGAERDFVRSFVYHAVQDALARSRAGDGSNQRRTQIAFLEAQNNPAMANILELLRGQELAAQAGGGHGLNWDELVARLSERPEVETWIKRVWSGRDDRFYDPVKLANFLLLREFMRRPRRGNTLETRGMACLRAGVVQNLPVSLVPSVFKSINGSHQDWKDFLEIVLTYLVRANGAVLVEHDDRHWIQPGRPGQTYVRMVTGQRRGRNEIYWPSANSPRLARPILLLSQAFGLPLADPQAREILTECLDQAWTSLTPLMNGRTAVNGALSLQGLSVSAVSEAWICPVTKRLLDVTLRGLSIYGATHAGALGASASKVRLPVLPAPFLDRVSGRSPEDARSQISEWLAKDETVADLRDKGVWGDISDRLALFSDYYRSAEHSAQQPPQRLRRYEKQFREGTINILNCSTTMEMGVDIGSVSEVLMTNVPPSIVNYRQRVGRAGRRRQPMSLGFTICKDRPFDRDTFSNPVQFLSRIVRAPKVALDSRVVVQRHVNALLFATFTSEQSEDALSLKAGAFFGCPSGPGAGEPPDFPAKVFLTWIGKPSTADGLASRLSALTKGSILENDNTIVDEAGLALNHAREGFANEWRALQRVLAERKPADKAATRGLEIQVKRLCDDFLLSALSGRGFLPAHGFPTGVVQFVTPGEARKDLGTEEGTRFNSYPSRQRDVAIREYAPGAEVVLDGLVYRSAGVTLNWKRPANAEDVSRDIQNLMTRWSCGSCGEAESTRHGVQGGACPACGAADVRLFKILEPAGFRSDRREKAHADADMVSFVPSLPTHVSARGAEWSPFLDPSLGRSRTNREGSVFFCTAGPTGDGYDVCLQCGRAQPHTPIEDDNSAPRWEHSPLIGRGDADGLCVGGTKPFAVQRPVRLAHEIATDVFELQAAPLNTVGAGIALAAALREALARDLGVEPDEMGIAADRRARPSGGKGISVFLFDRAAGGAGFAIQADERWPTVLAEAIQILDCQAPGCVVGCPACVLTADMSEKEVAVLDRFAALDAARRMAAEAEPRAEDMAAPSARLVKDLFDALDSEIDRGARHIRVHGATDVDLAEWQSMSPSLDRLRARGAKLDLCLPSGSISQLDSAARLALRDVLSRLEADLYEGSQPVFPNGARLLAEARKPDGVTITFATRDEDALQLGTGWGRPVRHAVVKFETLIPYLDGQRIAKDELRAAAGTVLRMVSNDLNGPLSSFGKRAAKLIRGALAETGIRPDAVIQRLSYSDRYLRSPLTLKLCLDTLAALAPTVERHPTELRTGTLPFNEKSPTRLADDWRRAEDRMDVAAIYGHRSGLAVTFLEVSADHARQLTLTFVDGTVVTILMDQGFGAWRTDRAREFDFRRDPTVQAQQLRATESGVTLSGGGTWMVFHRQAN